MDFSTALLRDLLHLSSSVELDEDELGARMAALVTALRTAVPSYRGMYLTVVEDDEPVGLSAFESTEDGAITTSLRLPFAALAPGFHVGSRVVFYAASPGAFVDLAADIGPALKLNVPVIWVNRHGEKLDGRKAPDANVRNLRDAAAKLGAK